MPSLRHEALVELFRYRPALAAELLRDALGVEVPAFTEARADSETLTLVGVGRRMLRERVGVEHRHAHLARRQGPRGRYRGVRKNVFELRRAACIQNLESWQRHLESPSATVGQCAA